MSLNLNIDNYGSRSVVPITCNNVQGTGFYIGANCLLTAFHVVSDAKFDGANIIATISGKQCPCSLIEVGDMDVVILKSLLPIDDATIEKIPLLDTEFKKDLNLQIIGFPQEIGNGIDYFGVSVKNVRMLNDHSKGFDTVVQRTDAFGFYSYSGFSGSPVLNEFGYAVGVVTDQLHRSLGYTSIKSIAKELVKELEKYKIFINSNADELDTRPYGIGTCIKAAEKSLQKMSSRYCKELHVEDDDFDEFVRLFCGLGVKEEQDKLHSHFISWYQTLPQGYKEFCDNYTHFKHYLNTNIRDKDFYWDIECIATAKDPIYSEETYIKAYYLNTFQALLDELRVVQDAEQISKEKYLYISADAGYGKTHHLCHITQKICKETNIYLFFGTEFNTSSDPLRTIAGIRNWEDENYLKALNDEVASKGRYAIFVLDALNEGEGTFFWNEKLSQLINTLDTYPNIKLIVSVRTMESDDELLNVLKAPKWIQKEIGGFSDLNKALSKYFDFYKIFEETTKYKKYKEFRCPLFLKIFCESYYELPLEKRTDIDILLLYRLYFHKRNRAVSRGADEDPQRNVAGRLIYSIGERSLLTYHCNDIPRDKAVSIANKLCRNRLWSNNLYHSAIRENILMEYSNRLGEKLTMFQYDSMGDFVRANNIMVLNKTDQERFDYIKRLLNNCKSGNLSHKEINKTLNTVTAFLAVWNPDDSYWEKNDFKSGLLRQTLVSSLADRNLESKSCTLKKTVVQELLKNDNGLLDVNKVFQQFALYKDVLMPYLHDRLKVMDMLERDEKWTIGVNGLLDTYRLSYTINSVYLETVDDIKTYVWILCWMMTSSHPNLRCRLMRIVRVLLSDNPQLCTIIIDMFHDVNDPYVLSGVYGSIYGVLLLSRDKSLIHEVSERVYQYHYENQIDIPTELNGRIWTLKILEYNQFINPEDSYWKASQPPYAPKSDPMSFPDTEVFNNDYFGPEGGAHTLYHSLFAWDFNRYIIGTNSNNESKSFIKNGVNVRLDKITEAVAYRIKHVYGYSNILSEYDKSVAWEDRHYHSKERIGKKYQWIALGEVKAYLCDICSMTKDWFTEEPADVPYPWYADRTSHFDPTFKVFDNQQVFDNEIFDYLPTEDLFGSEGIEWLNSREQLPQHNIILTDKQQNEWVVLVGYQKYTEEKDGEKRESFLYYSPCLVKNIKDNADRFEEWAKNRNFYGRWMPESTGNYEFLWNECPWSDCYRQFDQDEIEIWRNEAPCKIKLPYSAQLQEDRMAIDDDDVIDSTVYMPCRQFYEMFGLYNAERGVVRDSTDKIIAINRHIPKDSLDGLVIRREYLDKFLSVNQYTLFYCNLGEKQLWMGKVLVNMQRLSSCCRYHVGESIQVVQPLTDERDL